MNSSLTSKKPNPRRLWSMARALVVVSLVAAAACDDDTVRFGPPNNLQFPDSGSAAVCKAPEGSTGETCPDWETVVFPLLESYGCTNSACHSETKASGDLALYEGDATKTYEALAAFTNGAGRPYVADSDAADPNAPPYMLCNLTASPPVGPLMPPGGMMKEDLVIVGNWALCGMRLKGGTPVTPDGSGGGGGGGP